MPLRTSPLASLRILPSSRVMTRAISSARCRARLAARHSTRPRSGPGVFFQLRNAACAASIARSASAAVAAGNSAMTSFGSAGLTFRTMRDDCGVKANFFIPGHTVESCPAETESILNAGHEVAHHSYAHVDPSEQSAADERADMERAWRALERIGVQPLGFRSPSADYSTAT